MTLVRIGTSFVQFKPAVVLRKTLCRVVVKLDAAQRLAESVEGVKCNVLAKTPCSGELKSVVRSILV